MSTGENNLSASFLGINSPRVKNLGVKNPAPNVADQMGKNAGKSSHLPFPYHILLLLLPQWSNE